jgi:hypothetical protein
VTGALVIGRPDPRVVGRRGPFQFTEAPLAQRLGDGDLGRAEVRAHNLRRLPCAGEVRRADHGIRWQVTLLSRRERLPAAKLRQPPVAAAVSLDPADDDAGLVRLALPVPHDAVAVREAIHAAEVIHDLPDATTGASQARK